MKGIGRKPRDHVAQSRVDTLATIRKAFYRLYPNCYNLLLLYFFLSELRHSDTATASSLRLWPMKLRI